MSKLLDEEGIDLSFSPNNILESFTVKSSNTKLCLNIAILIIGISILAMPVAGNTVDSKIMADSFLVSGNYEVDSEDIVSIPVKIINVDNGPIQTIIFDVSYDDEFLLLDAIEMNTLASDWISTVGNNKRSITLSTFEKQRSVVNGSTGTLCTLNFKVIDNEFDSIRISLDNVDFANVDNVHGKPANSDGFAIFKGDVTSEDSMPLKSNETSSFKNETNELDDGVAYISDNDTPDINKSSDGSNSSQDKGDHDVAVVENSTTEGSNKATGFSVFMTGGIFLVILLLVRKMN